MSRAALRRWPEQAPTVPAPATSASGITITIAAFVTLHLLIGPVFYEIRQIAVLHAIIVTAVGGWWAISRNRPIEAIAYVGAYVTSSEVLWRVARVSGYVLFWEFAKYLLVGLFLMAMVAKQHVNLRKQALPLLYFAALLPSAAIPLLVHEFSLAREDISFNLSGPLALTMSALFFGQVDLKKIDRFRLLLAIIGPGLSLGTLTLFLTISANVDYSQSQSIKATSGWFGANQVSASLALAALCAFLYILEDGTSKALRALMFLLMAFLLVQSAMTFSRGGLYMFVGAALVATFCLVTDATHRMRLLVAVGLIALVANYVLIPELDRITDGAILERFSDTGLTGRDSLMESDLELWRAHPWLGVGPGQSSYLRDMSIVAAAGHTEFSRALAEHGAFGLVSVVLLGAMGMRVFRATIAPPDKALALSVVVWSLLFMATTGMRMVAPAFLIGLATARPIELALRWRPVYFRQPDRRLRVVPKLS